MAPHASSPGLRGRLLICFTVSCCQYDEVVDSCTAALELDPRYVKAFLRRAQANEHLEKYDVALEGAVYVCARVAIAVWWLATLVVEFYLRYV